MECRVTQPEQQLARVHMDPGLRVMVDSDKVAVALIFILHQYLNIG